MSDNAQNFIPLFERVLVKPDSVETTTETGIILPVGSRKRPNTGIVISIGHLVPHNSQCPVKPGDRVLYQRYAGLDVKISSEGHHLVMANDLIAILGNDSNTIIEISENGG